MTTAIDKATALLAVARAFEKYTDELSHFYYCIDFAKSHLDGRAITFMNVGIHEFMADVKKIIGEM